MTGRTAAVWAVGNLALLAVAAGCANQTTWVTPPTVLAPGPVNGLLLDAFNRPLPDQIIAIGAEKTTTNVEGRFAFASVPVNYDLVIARPDGTQATVYQGLTRRDPIVVFAHAPSRGPVHKASIAVTLAGADTGQASWSVSFASARASEVPRDRPRASAQPLEIQWDGADTVSGVVIALSMRREKHTIPLALFAQQAVTLRAGQAAAIALRPTKAPVVRRPSPIVDIAKEDAAFYPEYSEEYRLPGVGFATYGGNPAQVAYDTPDLTGFGLQFCARGFQGDPYLRSERVQCGVAPGKQTTIVLARPPVFKSPAWDTPVTPGTSFSWTPVPGGVYRLSLGAAGSAEHPQVEIVTARTETVWPDLQVVGVGFPRPLATYAVVIGTLGPVTSMDDLVSPQGLSDPVPRDRWRAESQDLSIAVEPPLGKEEAACVFEETVLCATKPRQEYYRLSAINRKIRRYPEFAATVRIHCVRDCAGARTYTNAYQEYSEAHPGFDANEPRGTMIEHEPEPPPEMFRRRAWSGGR